jgi:hypothetical protein
MNLILSIYIGMDKVFSIHFIKSCILPIEKDIIFFIDVINMCINFYQNPIDFT